MVEEDGRLHLAEPERPMLRFGLSEAHAISLALERNWLLLINDSRALEFAEQLGISALSVPDFCVLLFAEGKITLAAAQGYIQRVSTTTSSRLTRRAIESLAQLLDDGGASP